MSGTFGVAEAVELAVIERDGFIESRHAGSAIVLAPDGSVIRRLGEPAAPIFPRSSLKPFQALAVMTAGVPLQGAAAVLATASHAGTPAHVDIVRAMLAEGGLAEDALQCPADWPLDRAARDELIRLDAPAAPVYMNCSGKHAAMLRACVRNGWSTESYLDPQHPLQLHVRDVVERLAGEKVSATATDGCGAPVHAISLAALAHGTQRIATAATSSPFALFRNAALLREAVRADGWAIDGPGRDNTIVIDRLGLFAKGGAEGVMIAAAQDGTTVALKVLDGASRAKTAIAVGLLESAGAVPAGSLEALHSALGLDVLGGGVPVGRLRVTV